MQRIIWIVALIAALAGKTVEAQDPGALDASRFVWALDGGLKGYSGDTPAEWTMVAPATAGAIGWSANPKMALALRAGQDWANTAHEVELGPRYYLVGGDDSRDWRVSIGVNAAYLFGSGNERFTVQPDGSNDPWSWNLPVTVGRKLTKVLNAKLSGRYDPKHEDITALVTIGVNGNLGGAR